ncbi:carboxypeptidase-like regulatory domain-containing protein [Corallococcus sp. EGB]|uniref:carboxypeptidase-like regulatory domain-containing protein n=1 Tax=Corallococcus sp. EGB TaxID=1521117 RepID=UPI001CC0A995|nr:carboxypeptidase-like regulatory domain-containing protein [Corallococcus sp. EGB]
MKKHVLMAVLPLLAWGCGDPTDADNDGVADGIRDPNNVSVVVPSTPKGTVSGQVLTTTLQPLADVTVAMTIGSQPTGKSATTDASGNFVMKDVPAGAEVLLTFSKSGYSTLRATSTVPSSAGTVPINNGNASFGPVTLTQLNSSLSVNVVTPQGRPAVGAKGVLEVDKAGSVILGNADRAASVVSKVYVEATADSNGVMTFTGVPSGVELARLNGSYNLWIAPMDSNGDGVVDTGGYAKSYSGAAIVGTQVTALAQLAYSKPSSAGNLAIEGGNVASLKGDFEPLRNMVRPGESVYVYFNQPVQPGSLVVRLTDEYAKEGLPVTASVNVGGYSVTITPASGVVQEGKEYNIFIRASAAEGGSNYSQTGFFFGGDQGSPRALSITDIRYQETSSIAPASSQLNSGETVYVTFSAPIKALLGTTAQVFFNEDLDGNGAVGNVQGEVGNAQGFPLFSAEPTAPYVTSTPGERPVFGITPSTYTTRYSFTYVGSTPFSQTQIGSLKLKVEFSRLIQQGYVDAYETIWGQAINEDVSGTGMVMQQKNPNIP